MAPVPTLTLNDGLEMPRVGLGTYTLTGPNGVAAMVAGIRSGYRLLDSAVNYENEGALGRAVREAGVNRDHLVLQTKLPGRHHRREAALTCIHESLYRAGLDHWDVVVIHWPNPSQGLYVEAFAALLELREAGLVRSVGVSNFLPEHLERLRAEVGELPSVNQIQLHPFWSQAEARAIHEQLGVVTQSWSPLGRKLALVDDPTIRSLADQVGVSPARLILRWHVQLGAVPLPKSADPQRQRDNMALFDFELDEQVMARINALTRPDGSMGDFDPRTHEEY
ncbi:aldo/keto reductase [Schaalia sp. 19OD2882]|nr:aldo/keto reductase [Schaalia sp. 19OD2882]